MSSTLRTSSVPVGYFVMSNATFDSSLSGDEIFRAVDNSDTFVYDLSFYEDLSNFAILTFEDYGITEYSASVTLGDGTETAVDLRKVVLVSVSAPEATNVSPEQYANVDGARYVPLGTLRNTSTPFENSTVPSSVQLIGKFF